MLLILRFCLLDLRLRECRGRFMTEHLRSRGMRHVYSNRRLRRTCALRKKLWNGCSHSRDISVRVRFSSALFQISHRHLWTLSDLWSLWNRRMIRCPSIAIDLLTDTYEKNARKSVPKNKIIKKEKKKKKKKRKTRTFFETSLTRDITYELSFEAHFLDYLLYPPLSTHFSRLNGIREWNTVSKLFRLGWLTSAG